MAGLPISFAIPGEAAVASYDWFDFATGAGYKQFYCVGGYNSVAKQYFLTTQALESDEENQFVQIGAGTSDLDFDITWGKPIILAASPVYFRVKITTTSATAYMTVNVYHVTTGGTETSLGQGISDTLPTDSDHVKVFKFDITKKSFGVGEKLRINTILTSSGSSSSFVYNAGTAGSEMSVQIPFEVQL